MGRKSQAIGRTGEDIAMIALRTKGVQMVEQIATPITITARQGVWVQYTYKQKVSGDFRGIMPGGRRVLAEVKTCTDRLVYSRLEPHQVEALDENHKLGGVSLLVMVSDINYVVMRWPIAGFGPRKSITAIDAFNHEWDGWT
jgi:penicillin-binding protein-related factor A (putative recombinase)